MNSSLGISSATKNFHNTLASNGWAQSTLHPLAWILVASTISTDTILSINTTPEFSEGDRTNGFLKSWLDTTKVWSKCTYMGQWFEMIQSGGKKLLMFSEIIMKSGNEIMKHLTVSDWIQTIDTTIWIIGLKVMTKNQIKSIGANQYVFPDDNIYLSSSPHNYYFWAWHPAYSQWRDYGFANTTSCYDVSYRNTPKVVRCVLELS